MVVVKARFTDGHEIIRYFTCLAMARSIYDQYRRNIQSTFVSIDWA